MGIAILCSPVPCAWVEEKGGKRELLIPYTGGLAPPGSVLVAGCKKFVYNRSWTFSRLRVLSLRTGEYVVITEATLEIARDEYTRCLPSTRFRACLTKKSAVDCREV